MPVEFSIEKINCDVQRGSFNCGNPSLHHMIEEYGYYWNVMRLYNSSRIIYNEMTVGYFIVGMTTIETEDNKYYAVDLRALCVDCEYQGIGIGSATLDYIVQDARAFSEFTGCRYLVLDAIQEYVEWYEEHGFQIFAPEEVSSHNVTVKMFIDFQDEELINQYYIDHGRDETDVV